ncbi:hypothetical protein OsJ_26181 [Oryza sativa Japonica Group]|uniref:Uncharacterized protein n=1 Tax=Oryza sativa subsp. japonica TaxID=39947 RepID=Q6ZCP5_ORYSJ|nr:hypothetical protein OsJ_26181 [Oryza sativa Japonica Group]BAC99544.1 hypothetical protein [Oryza sativa Japonica Group]
MPVSTSPNTEPVYIYIPHRGIGNYKGSLLSLYSSARDQQGSCDSRVRGSRARRETGAPRPFALAPPLVSGVVGHLECAINAVGVTRPGCHHVVGGLGNGTDFLPLRLTPGAPRGLRKGDLR